MERREVWEYLAYSSWNSHFKVNKEGEFIARGRIEDIEYDEESESENDSSESGDSYSYNHDSDEESYETDMSSEAVEI